MSDTVKLIVTLSKGQYESLKNIQCGSIGSRMIVNAVMNGIPLDDVKAEIDKAKRYKGPNANPYLNKHDVGLDRCFDLGLDKALKLLDNIDKGSEGK